jgi:hypothetical protein
VGFGEPSERGGGAGGGVGFDDFYFISNPLEMNSMDGMDVKTLQSSQSLLDYNQELAEAEARIAQGDFNSHEEMLHALCTKKQSRN